jgi:hypothetical protein
MKQTQIFLLLAVLGSTLTGFGQSTSAAAARGPQAHPSRLGQP